jgi:hypothetical protein
MITSVLLLTSGLPIRSQQESRAQTARNPAAVENNRDARIGSLSLTEAEEVVSAIKSGGVEEFESQVIEIIKGRGVSFFADDSTLSALRGKGATDAIIELIRRIAPARPKPNGTLKVRCAPAVCNIKINDRTYPTDRDGLYAAPDLPPGQVTVAFEKEGYDTVTRTVPVTVEPGPEVSVELQLSSDTKAKRGKELLVLMLGALGMDSGAKDFPPLTGSGSIASYVAGKQSDWNFNLAIGSPSSLIQMIADSPAGNLIYQCSGQRCGEVKKGHFPLRGTKAVQPVVAEGLETNLRAFNQYHLVPFLQALRSSSARLSALTAEAKTEADQHLQAEFSDSVYNVTLGPDLLPTGVEYESKGGLGSGRKILFGDYETITGGDKLKDGGVFRYPKRTTIRLSDAEQHGVEVKLDKVEWSTFRASDFSK